MFHRIREHTWYLEPDYRTDRPSLGYICGSRFAFAADAGASKAHVELFYSYLKKEGLRLPDLTGISHYHWDHSYGAPYVSGMTIASDKCNEILKRETGYQWTEEAMQERLENGEDVFFTYYYRLQEYPDPFKIKVVSADIEIQNDITIDLGGVHVVVMYCGGPHSEDHLMFYVPEDKVIYLSDANTKDLVLNQWTFDPDKPEELQDRILEIPHFMDRLKPYIDLMDRVDFEIAVPGHAEELQSKETVMKEMKRYL